MTADSTNTMTRRDALRHGLRMGGVATPMRPRVLMLAHRIPYPADKGDKIRAQRWMSWIAARSDLYLACFVDDRRDAVHVETLRGICRDVTALPLRRGQIWRRSLRRLTADAPFGRSAPLTVAAYRDEEMARRLHCWSRLIGFDAVLAFSGAMAPYALEISARRRVLDLCDCDSRKWSEYAERDRARLPLDPRRMRGWLLGREGRALHDAERNWLRRFDAVTVVNDRERRLLRDASAATASVVRNGVDLPEPGPLPQEPVAGFIGALDYAANVDGLAWFVRNVWPIVRRRIPAARFLIVGRAPTAAVRRMHRVAGIEVTGSVPDVEPHWRAMRVAALPLRIARGVQNKLLEAMAFGRPVVATSAVVGGLDLRPAPGIRTADEAESFATELVDLLGDPDRCSEAGREGRRFVEMHLDWRRPCEAMWRLLLGQAPTSDPANIMRRRYRAAPPLSIPSTPSASIPRRSDSPVMPSDA